MTRSVPPLVRASGFLLACLLMAIALLSPQLATSQAAPDAPPDPVPFFYDTPGIFNDDQLATLNRDARLLQSTNIPTLVYVRQVSPDEAAVPPSQALADELRHGWGIASSAGADDGLVMLFSWVPDDPAASSVVLSYGQATFESSGLTPASIQHTIDSSVHAFAREGYAFDALVYLMRETRYTGIYAPPPPPPIEGTALTVHDALARLGWPMTVSSVLVFAGLSLRFWRRPPARHEIWTVVGLAMTAILLLWTLAVYSQSRTGVLTALAILACLGIATFAWTHAPFTTRSPAAVRRRYVPPTRRLLRKRWQIRTMLLRSTGDGR